MQGCSQKLLKCDFPFIGYLAKSSLKNPRCMGICPQGGGVVSASLAWLNKVSFAE
jgi:hypothetical protein